MVISGATTGDASPAELSHIFFRQLSVLGSTMGTRDELTELVHFCMQTGIRPLIHQLFPLRDTAMASSR